MRQRPGCRISPWRDERPLPFQRLKGVQREKWKERRGQKSKSPSLLFILYLPPLVCFYYYPLFFTFPFTNNPSQPLHPYALSIHTPPQSIIFPTLEKAPNTTTLGFNVHGPIGLALYAAKESLRIRSWRPRFKATTTTTTTTYYRRYFFFISPSFTLS